jgi:UDP-N-acetylmuramate--alanine ligase
MSGIAEAYAAAGVPVSGSDRDDSETLAELSAAGVRTFVGHDADQLGDAETVVVSSAIKADNPELARPGAAACASGTVRRRWPR